jgi:hypothetical protein
MVAPPGRALDMFAENTRRVAQHWQMFCWWKTHTKLQYRVTEPSTLGCQSRTGWQSPEPPG